MYTIYCSRPPTCTYEGKEIVHSVFCILYSVCARSRSLCVMRVCVVQVCTVHVCVRCVSIVHIRYAHTTNAHSYHAPPCTLPVHHPPCTRNTLTLFQVEELEESQLQCQTMLTMKNVTPFKEDVQVSV